MQEKICIFNGKLLINSTLVDELNIEKYKYIILQYNKWKKRVLVEFITTNRKNAFRISKMIYIDYVNAYIQKYSCIYIQKFLDDNSIKLDRPRYYVVKHQCEKFFYFDLSQ
jgi:hypothetical protein